MRFLRLLLRRKIGDKTLPDLVASRFLRRLIQRRMLLKRISSGITQLAQQEFLALQRCSPSVISPSFIQL